MRTAKAMSAAALALTIVAAPVTAHAVPKPITIMPGDTIISDYVVATGTSSLPATASTANWVSLSASPSTSRTSSSGMCGIPSSR